MQAYVSSYMYNTILWCSILPISCARAVFPEKILDSVAPRSMFWSSRLFLFWKQQGYFRNDSSILKSYRKKCPRLCCIRNTNKNIGTVDTSIRINLCSMWFYEVTMLTTSVSSIKIKRFSKKYSSITHKVIIVAEIYLTYYLLISS